MNRYKLKPLVFAMAIASPALALAQEQDASAQGQSLEEITVTGYRASLEKALDSKRNSANSTDSIIAEDMGKMPDLNLAESLQRVPGVAITREGGEGRKITVRGLGPGYSRTTLNGMEVPASSGGLDSTGGVNRGRDFDFNVFSSDVFNQITIHKSPIASVEEGGIASTVELTTRRPFDDPGQHFYFGGQMMADSFAGEEDPRLSSIYSNTFLDDKLGVLVSVAYSERTVRQEGFGSVRWTAPAANGNRSWGGDGSTVINGTPNPQANYPDADGERNPLDYMFTPRLPRMDSFNRDQERLGLTGSFQFAPTEEMEFTLDVVHSKLEQDMTSYNYFSQFRNTFDNIVPTEVTLDPSGRYIMAGTFENVAPRSESRGQFSETDFTQVVLSGKFDIADNMTLDLMYGNAVAEHTEDQLRFNITATEGHEFSYDFSENRNIAEMSYGFDILDVNNYEWTGATLRRDIVKRENDTFRADFTIDGDSSQLKTGLIWNSRDVISERWDPVGSSTPAALLASHTNNLASLVDDFGSGFNAPSGFPSDWLVADFNESKTAYKAGNWARNELDSSTYDINEETLGGYVEGNLDTEFLGLPLTVNSGLRIVHTEVNSDGVISDGSDGVIPTSHNASYTEVLPSTNLVLELQEDLLLRLGVGRNFSRPGLGNLSGTVSVTPINGSVSMANPDLEPERANSVDLGMEWYFADESVLALTLFYKDIESFITTSSVGNQTLPPDLQAIVAARPEYDPSSSAYEENSLDPFSGDWVIRQATNGEGATVEGYEVAWQQPFRYEFLPNWAQNFGALANYTHVKSIADYGNGIRGPLQGLSENSYNYGIYYEIDNFGARVMVNNRDDYVTRAPGGDGNATEATTGPTRVDLSAYYDVTDNIQITLEGINVTNEPERLYTTGPLGDQDFVREYNFTGREVLLGMRVNF